MTDRELADIAKRAREKAYAPYSNYLVGAALLAKNGEVYTGCNIENAAFSPTNCAERTAFFKAVSQGAREFEVIAVVGGARGATALSPVFPCGVCRQVMLEFCDAETFRVVTQKSGGKPESVTLKELVPHPWPEK
ncbi:MAG TPA: cytidine deaminase [Clostridiales bacterium]|nr:cytidine deaminase [Clostridiales bacterium]